MPGTMIELSHEIEHGMMTYKGIPTPVISDYLSREASRSRYSAGTEFQIGKIEMAANTGTYIDSPFHRYAGGMDLSGLPLSSIADIEGIIIEQHEVTAIGRAAFEGKELNRKAVLVHTGWDVHWRTDRYFENNPYLTRDAAQYLADVGAALVGIDSLNIDDTKDGTRPAHTILLGAHIPIVEHMCNLGKLPKSGFRFFAVPPMIKGFGSFPVRAFAITSIRQDQHQQ